MQVRKGPRAYDSPTAPQIYFGVVFGGGKCRPYEMTDQADWSKRHLPKPLHFKKLENHDDNAVIALGVRCLNKWDASF